MDLNKKNMKKLYRLLVFAAFLCLTVIYIKEVTGMVVTLLDIVKPFIIGAAMAFVLNIPMRFIEKHCFGKSQNKYAVKLKRPVSILLTLIAVFLLLTFVVLIVVPQITETIIELGHRIPVFVNQVILEAERIFAENPQLLAELQELENVEIDWSGMLSTLGGFLKNGVGSVVASTVNVAGSIIGGIVNVFVAFVFALYLLSGKEKLGNQADRTLKAFLSAKAYTRIKKVLAILNHNFSSFITGQCTEAVILGMMFLIVMSIFGFPYAVLIGVLITVTALIPIVGAFIGCAVGTFLIMIDDPVKALWFLVLFLVLQQIEGNLIYPHVVGSSVGLPSVWVLVAVSVGGSMMGVLGMLIFIPLVSTVYMLTREAVNTRNAADPVKKKKSDRNAGE